MNIPNHIAIIMDGNGRWAKERNLPRIFGHKEGAQRVREIIKEANKLGVKVVTVFAFSTENWNRPRKEVGLLFSYLDNFLKIYAKELTKDDVKLKMLGRRDRINPRVLKRIESIEKLTQDNKSLIFNIALDYGGRWDIVQAAQKAAYDCVSKKISPGQIDENLFKNYLSLSGVPEPDLLIRTSGEKRISNFLLWDSAYSELYFPKIYWPSFNKDEFKKAIEIYSKRKRRFGSI